jgi:hypothetical protein
MLIVLMKARAHGAAGARDLLGAWGSILGGVQRERAARCQTGKISGRVPVLLLVRYHLTNFSTRTVGDLVAIIYLIRHWDGF